MAKEMDVHYLDSETVADGKKPTPVFVLEEDLLHSKPLQEAVQKLGGRLRHCPVKDPSQALALMENQILITSNFVGDLFQLLRVAKKTTIVSPMVLINHAKIESSFPRLKRPLYNHVLQGIVIVFVGYNKDEEDRVDRIAQKIHNMDGKLRPDFPKTGSSTTHRDIRVVTRRVVGGKYQHAVNMNFPIMNEKWIEELWQLRDQQDAMVSVNQENFRAKPFLGLKLFLIGFGESDLESVKTQVTNNDGMVAATVQEATHIVVDDANAGSYRVSSEELSGVRYVTITRDDGFTDTIEVRLGQELLKSEWFWESIKIDACVEPAPYSLLVIEAQKKGERSKQIRDLFLSPRRLPNSSRLSAVDESGCSFASLDRSADSLNTPNSEGAVQTSKRYQTVMEMLETERSYVRILAGIIKIVDSAGAPPPEGPLLPEKEDKQLQDFFLEVHEIHAVHVVICHELTRLTSPWNEEARVGQVWLQNSSKLEKAYPPFVNLFETIRGFVSQCEKKFSRFQAMLMLSQKDPEYGRQHLRDLLIRPVQRLPSVQLLLKDLQKRTKETLLDHQDLGKAAGEIDRILLLVNEKKREAETISLMSSIENLPPEILTTYRKYFSRIDCVELNDNQLHGLGTKIAFLVCSDLLEAAKIRPPVKEKLPLKHLRMVPLREIISVVDVFDCGEAVRGAFVINLQIEVGTIWSWKFALTPECLPDKADFLKTLSTQISYSQCNSDPNRILRKMSAEEAGIEPSDFAISTTWDKACKLKRVVSKRITSIGKRSGQKLKRAVSSAFLSPANRMKGEKEDAEGHSSPKKMFRR